MRSIGRLTTGLALLSLFPAVAAAQETRTFTDAWFWGVKAGAMSVPTPVENEIAPMVGVDWLITRTRGGLYLSYEHGFLDDTRSTVDGETVELGDYRRASFSLMAFPREFGSLRPYAGIGMALNFVNQSNPVSGAGAVDPTRLEDARSNTSFVLMGGVQAGRGPVAFFAQASAMPTDSRFVLNDGGIYMLEAGLRFNVGSAIERIDR